MNDSARIEQFIASAPWRFAKTRPYNPHWYTVRGETPDEDFEWFVKHIRENGYRVRYMRSTYICLNVGLYRYWSLGYPVPATVIINRQFIQSEEELALQIPGAPPMPVAP